MKRRTRNYARRQLTWMRKLAGVTVIDRTADRPMTSPRRSSPPGEGGPSGGDAPTGHPAQNAATNGYMSTTATSTPNAHRPRRARAPSLRPVRHASAAA